MKLSENVLKVYFNVKNVSVLMYICCALDGAIKDSVSQNARCNGEKKKKDVFSVSELFQKLPTLVDIRTYNCVSNM